MAFSLPPNRRGVSNSWSLFDYDDTNGKGDWCNVKNTGFGIRPTTNTGDALEDAFVWIKPGGEGDVSVTAIGH